MLLPGTRQGRSRARQLAEHVLRCPLSAWKILKKTGPSAQHGHTLPDRARHIGRPRPPLAPDDGTGSAHHELLHENERGPRRPPLTQPQSHTDRNV